MTTIPINTPVQVDPGDLSEVQQAAAAWAGYLRKRIKRSVAARELDEAAADRIDQANYRLREQTYPKAAS